MQRVMIIGSCGAGKSTLAVKLSAITGLAVTHLDAIYWQPGWLEPDKMGWHQIIRDIVLQDKWLIDGNYSGTINLRIERADTIIYLDFNRLTCLYRIFKRYFKYRGTTRPDMQANCPERLDPGFIKYVWDFPSKKRTDIYEKIEQVQDQKKVIILKSPREAAEFLRVLEKQAEAL